MADKLTPQQAQAVNDRGGMLLVSAAAGSGKTKVLVDRLMKYLTDPTDPANLDEFLIITYTKAAASELRGKIAAKLSERIAQEPDNKHLQKQMQRLFLTKISTVHGFCGDILREYAYRLDLAADFRVADENECREIRNVVMQEILDEAYRNAGKDLTFRAFVDTQGLGRDDRLVPEILEKVYDSARCHLDPDGWLESCLRAVDVECVTDAAQTLWGRYLVEELKGYLDDQIVVLRRCVEDALACPGLEKPVVNLKQTLEQLERLRGSETWDEIVKNKNLDYGRLTFPRKCDDPELVERIKAARNACKKGLEKQLHSFTDDSARVLQDLAESAEGAEGIIRLVRSFDRAYTKAKRSRRCVDFGDLEHMTLDLLLGKHRSGPTAAAAEIGSRFREIMVDEYQDSNGVQDAIFSALTGKRNNCFMVGDVKQSIYQFRLADPGIFLEKYQRYVPAEDAEAGQGRKVLLSHNFRSGAEVIEAVNDVFATCMSQKVGGLNYGEAEALREGVPHGALGEPGVELHALQIREDTYEEEAAFVAARIRQMLDEGCLVRCAEGMRPVTAEDIVILLRSPGSVGAHFQQALAKQGIRCAAGGGKDLLKSMEIAILRSLLQTIANPRLDIPLISVLASPIFGFTADDLACIRANRRNMAVFDALKASGGEKAEAFLEVLDRLRRTARMCRLTELLEQCFHLTRLDSICAAMEDGETRSGNLLTFYQLAADFEAGIPRDLGQFLEHLDALEEKGLITAGTGSAGCVTIMSIHKSKGLEFPVVFLAGLSREFNRESTRAQILCDKELGLGLHVADRRSRTRYPTQSKRAIAAKMTAESLSEELRVLYVAMTRARDRLVMTYAARNLEGDLKDIALRMDFDDGKLLCRDVVCPGEWVLLTAMHRTEAGELFHIGGKPAQTVISEYPWKITVSEAPVVTGVIGELEQIRNMPEGALETMEAALGFAYPHKAATRTPSKQTATQRKGRQKDAEAAEQAKEPKLPARNWRKPKFLADVPQGKEYGNAIHAVMQYICYENCENRDAVSREVARLVERGFLTQQQGQMANCDAIAAFFDSSIGRKLRGGVDHIREFKFSILDDAAGYGDGLDGEQVLLQGVVDCAMLEDDGITVIDFKTDYVTEETLPDVVERYRAQVQTYANALAQIYEQTIKAQYLYFFRLNRFVSIV